MRKLTALAALCAAVLVPAAHGAATANADVLAAGRSCTTLKALVGTTTFGRVYATSKTCVDDWTLRARTARLAATSSCKAKGLDGVLLQACIVKGTATILTPKVKSYATAAKACAAELRELGPVRFAAKYDIGTAASAFGRCVSRKVRS